MATLFFACGEDIARARRDAALDAARQVIDSHAPLFYVLQDRHLSSLLVLEEETRRMGLPSPLDPVGPEFAFAERALFSVVLNRNPLSFRTDAPSATLAKLTDRLFRDPGFGTGHIVDFIQVWGFPAIFNGADIAIVSSMGLFILLSLRGVGLNGVRTPMVRTTVRPTTDDRPAPGSAHEE